VKRVFLLGAKRDVKRVIVTLILMTGVAFVERSSISHAAQRLIPRKL
jgi:hypothetical protein